jgi:hypothetical protein
MRSIDLLKRSWTITVSRARYAPFSKKHMVGVAAGKRLGIYSDRRRVGLARRQRGAAILRMPPRNRKVVAVNDQFADAARRMRRMRGPIEGSLMAVALAIVSVAATAVIIAVLTVAAVVIAAAAFAVAAIGLNDASREPQHRTGENNSQSHCHVRLHKVERILLL